MHLHSRFGWVWREPTAPPVRSSDVATDCAVGGWFSRVQVHRPSPELKPLLRERRRYCLRGGRMVFSSAGASTLAGTEAVTSRATSLLPARWTAGLSSTGRSTLGPKPNRYFASDVPAERRSSQASTTRFAMPASAALPHARGS